LGCSVSHSRRKEKGRAHLEDALVGRRRQRAGRRQDKWRRRQGRRARERRRVREKGRVEETERGAELQALSGKVPRNRGGDELGSPLMVALLREQGGSF